MNNSSCVRSKYDLAKSEISGIANELRPVMLLQSAKDKDKRHSILQ